MKPKLSLPQLLKSTRTCGSHVPTAILFMILFALSPAPCALSQIPQGFNYQAVARTSTGAPVASTDMQVKMSVLSDTLTPVIVWEELHSSVKTNASGIFGLVVGTGVKQTGSAADFSDIDWTKTPLYIKVQLYYQGSWRIMGHAKLWSVPYAMVAEKLDGPVSKLEVTGSTSVMDESLFEVKNRDGQTVFAVYNEGVRVYVDDGAKGPKGGFAIGGFGSSKAGEQQLLFVSPDSIRAYIDSTSVKGPKGGFAIGGFGTSKSLNEEYLRVTRDSTRVYVNDNPSKGVKGGFAIGGFGSTKGGGATFTSLTPENYFIGHEGGGSLTSGKYNSVLGYQSGKFITSGESNSFIGYQSGFNNNTGSGNLFLGYKTGYSNADGNYNSFLGYLAGQANTTGVFNTFLGSFSGYSNTEGSNNTFVGDSTGYFNKDGFQNTFIGTGCGNRNASGHENVFIGNHSGYNNTSGVKNIFIGSSAGHTNDDGENNVFIGTEAGHNFKNGNTNVYIGNQAGYKSQETFRNVFIGNNCGYSIKTGDDNVFLGTASGYSCTDPWGNVFIGHMSGYYSLDPPANVFVGERSGYKNTVGGNNVFVGQWSGYENISGSHNVYLGWSAGYSDTASIGNTLIGSNAGKLTQSGSENTFIGYFAGAKNIDGENNTVIGTYAGSDTTLGSGNIFLGYLTGKQARGNSNVFLGSGAGHSTVGDNNIFVGNWAGADFNGSGSLIIDIEPKDTDALIYGNFLDEKLWFNAQVKVISASNEWDEMIIEDTANSAVLGLVGKGNEWQYSQISMRSLLSNATWSINYNIDSTFALEFYNGKSTWLTSFSIDTLGKVSILNNGVDVNGNITPMAADTYQLGAAGNAWSAVYTTDGTIQTSDMRLKTNIADMEYGLNDIMKLHPVTFNWIGKEKDNLGLIAQDVAEVIKEVVDVGDDKEKTMGINYSQLVPVLIKGMQEQQAQIEAMKAEIAELKKR